jgi:murein DD-endopeptidase MepM/ murein hydrolase activator NlpD
VIATLCAASLPGHAQRRKHSGKKASSHSVSAEEAKAAAAKKEQIRQHLAGVRKHIHDVRVKLEIARQKEHQINETIGEVQSRIDTTKSTLSRVNHRLTVLTTMHVQMVARLTRTEDHLVSRRNLLAARLRENYERRQATYAQVLIQSRSVHELLTRGYYVRKIVHSDATLVKDIAADVHSIQRDKKALEEQQREERVLAGQFESQKAVYAADLGKKQTLLATVQEVREQAQDELDELESESNAMTSRIRELSEVLRQRQEALRREAIRRRQAGGKPQTGEDQAPELPSVFRGHFIRPVPGRITSGFGMRYHPILHVRKLHTGVDFGAPYGTPIHAAAAGVVLLAGYTRGYGNCIIIDHGGGIATLYGHCSSLGVSEGQSVKQGAVIGRVGATGYATGPHLHFEVRKNGVPVQPL